MDDETIPPNNTEAHTQDLGGQQSTTSDTMLPEQGGYGEDSQEGTGETGPNEEDPLEGFSSVHCAQYSERFENDFLLNAHVQSKHVKRKHTLQCHIVTRHMQATSTSKRHMCVHESDPYEKKVREFAHIVKNHLQITGS